MIRYETHKNSIDLKFDLKFWFFNVAIWTVPAILSTTIRFFGDIQTGVATNWFEHFLGQSPNWYTWSILTPIVLLLASKLIITKFNKWKIIPILFLLSLAISCVHISLLMSSYTLLGLELFSTQFYTTLEFLLIYTTQLNVVIYFAIVGIYYMISYFLRYRENEIQVAQLETKLTLGHLNSLKEQIHPHFLFNTLNMLNSLIRTESRENAVQVVSDLSDLLRTSFDTNQRQFHTLHDEVSFITKYLKLIEYRFQDKLTVNIHIADGIEQAQVPTLLLQPIVENALKHGVEKLTEQGEISVKITKNDQNLKLEICNTVSNEIADSFNADKSNGGFAMTKERLKLLYKDNASLNLTLTKPNCVCCIMSIPYTSEMDIE